MKRGTDSELLIRWRDGDSSAGTKLFQRYYGAMERFFINKVPDTGTEIRDLVQDTFMALVQRKDSVNPERFRSYLFRVAYNKFQEHLRKKYRRVKQTPIEDITQLSLHVLSPGPSTLLVKKREQRVLLEALRRLKVMDQTLLELYYWEQFRFAEIADFFSISRDAVKGRMRNARKRLETAIHEIAASAEILKSTLTDLDDWARQCREQIELYGDEDEDADE